MRFRIIHIGVGLLVALCVLVFAPITDNANLVKEILWRPWVFFLVGIFLISARNPEISILRRRSRRLGEKSHKVIFIFLFLWLVFSVINSLRSPSHYYAWIVILRRAEYIFLFIIFAFLFIDLKGIKIFFAMLRISAGLCSFYIILEYSGVDFISWKSPDRPPGTFSNPNFSANFLAAVFPLILLGEIFGRKIKIREKAFLHYMRSFPVCSVIVFPAILMTQSRAGFIALGAGILCCGIVAGTMLSGRKHRPSSGKRRYVLPILLGILALEIPVALAIWFIPDRLEHAFNATTVQLRIHLWKGAWNLFLEKPLAGWGAGSFGIASQKFLYLVEPIAGKKRALHAHSWVMELIAEHGLAGVIIFPTMICFILRRVWKKFTAEGNREIRIILGGAFSGIIALLAGTAFGVWLNWWGGAWVLWMLLGAGFAASLLNSEKENQPEVHESEKPSHVRKYFMSAGIILLLFSFFTTSAGIRYFRASYLSWKGNRLLARNRSGEALPFLAKSHDLFPYDPTIRFRKALALYQNDKTQQAAKIAKELISDEPEVSRYHQLMAQIEIQRKEFQKAESYLKNAFQKAPTGENAISLARFLISAGNINEAIRLMENQLTKAIYPPLLHFYLRVEKERGRIREAAEFISGLRKDLPFLKRKTKAELARWEAELSSLMGDMVHSMTTYRMSLILDPGDHQVWNDYALVLRELGRLEKADRAFARAEQIAPDNFIPAFNRLDLAMKRKDYALAERLIKKIEKMNMPERARLRVQNIKKQLTGGNR